MIAMHAELIAIKAKFSNLQSASFGVLGSQMFAFPCLR